MGLFSAAIDRSPVDAYGTQGNAAALSNYATSSMQQANELYDMGSSRNQMFKQQSMEDAFDIQAQQGIMAQRQAARSGQGFTPAGMDTSSAVRNQVQKQWAQQMMAQQGQAIGLQGQAGGFQAQAGSLRNSLNQLHRQQQQANQRAKQQSKAAKLSAIGAIGGAVLGPALGAVGGKLAGAIGGMGGGGSSMFSGNMMSMASGGGGGGGFGLQSSSNTAFGGGGFQPRF